MIPPCPVAAWARRTPDGLALEFGGRRWSYAQLDAEVGRWVAALRARGVGEGDRVAVLTRNRAEAVFLIHALGRMGAALGPLNARLTGAELAPQIGRLEAKLLLAEDALAAAAPGAVSLERFGAEVAALATNAAATASPPAVSESAPGTTSPESGAAAASSSSEPGGALAVPAPGASSPAPTGVLAAPTAPSTRAAVASSPARLPAVLRPAVIRPGVGLDRIRAILFTSGTTGQAKAAALSYRNFEANAAASALNLGGSPEHRWIGCLPLFHIGGLAMAIRCAIHGAALLLHAQFDADAVSRELDHGATHVSLVASTLQRTVEARAGRRFPPTFHAALIGGGPVPPLLLAQARALGAPVLQTYGLTEACSQVTTEPRSDADGATAGLPLPGVRIRVVDDQGEDVPTGEVGEIEVEGPTVMRGYYRDEHATHDTLYKGWLRTRDLGSLDPRGRLTVLSRRTDLIISGGENVYPAELEATLAAHPDVAEAAVLGIPDERWGQLPIAAVAVRREVSDEALLAWCTARLARFKVPRAFHRVSALPRNAGGKVDRAALRRLLSL